MDYCSELFNSYFNKLGNNIELVDPDFFKDFEYEYIIENFFVSYVFRKSFYAGDIEKEFHYMVVNFIFILLNMNTSLRKDREAVLESIGICEKILNHNATFKNVYLKNKQSQDVIIETLRLCGFYS
jgi:hypothetical protein